MNVSDKKILLQYSGGKDSTACLLTMLEKNLYFEAICFTHAYCYEIPISEAQRICKRFGVRLHLVDMSEQLLELFGENFFLRPCRFCKGIMDGLTVKFARENGFELICVGDTASDRTFSIKPVIILLIAIQDNKWADYVCHFSI